jgi:hypothetical protein
MIRCDNNIIVTNVKSKKDYKFVELCMNADDFNLYIHDSFTSPNKYKILKKEDKYLGIFIEKFSYDRCVRICSPNLYVKSKLSSIFCISIMMKWICEHKKWDKISFLVYSNNKPCLAIMNKMGVHLDGILKNADTEFMRNIYIYSILPNEMEDLKYRLNSLLKI